MPEAPQDPKEWIRQTIVDETHRRMTDETQRAMTRRSCANASAWRLAMACGAIGFGVLLFLGNVGILPAFNLAVFWPVIPMIFGVARFASGRPAGRLWGVFVIGICSIFLLSNLGWIHIRSDASGIFALILIGAGFLALISMVDSGGAFRPVRPLGTNVWRRGDMDHNSSVADLTILGSIKRKMDSRDFRGGDLTSVLGSIEIDLRATAIAPGPEAVAVVNAIAIFGAIKLRVPQQWRVLVRGVSVLGNFEDKTLPPNSGPDAPALVITGWSMFGSVEIED